jgi:hypothetical protein
MTMHTVVSSLGFSGMGPMLACSSALPEPDDEEPDPLEHDTSTAAKSVTRPERIEGMHGP